MWKEAGVTGDNQCIQGSDYHTLSYTTTVDHGIEPGSQRWKTSSWIYNYYSFFLDTLIDIKSYSSDSLSVTVGITVGACVFAVIGIVLASIAIR